MNTTQEKIITLARDFIQRLGYQSFSYKHIADVLNIQKAAVHHYFPAKEDLGFAVIEKDKQDFADLTKAVDNRSAAEKAESILELYTQYFSDGKKLCMISSCGAVFEEIPGKMQIAAKEHLNIIASWLTTTFKQGLRDGEFHFADTAENMTSKWITNLPGSLITGRIQGAEYFRNSIALLRDSLQTT